MQLEQNLACHLFPLSTSPGNNRLKVIRLVWQSCTAFINIFLRKLSSNTIRAKFWGSVTKTCLHLRCFNAGCVLRKSPQHIDCLTLDLIVHTFSCLPDRRFLYPVKALLLDISPKWTFSHFTSRIQSLSTSHKLRPSLSRHFLVLRVFAYGRFDCIAKFDWIPGLPTQYI